MKLDTRALRYLSDEDWRVLTAVETGSRNHELVPTALITSISGLRAGSGVSKSISTLAKSNLIARVKNAKYDGYRLTYGGLDHLALHTHIKKGAISSLGPRIGVGKESDIYMCASPEGRSLVLKIHRLGRISFRAVKSKRDYLQNGKKSAGSWMYMSRLAAHREWGFLRALHQAGYVVPDPVGWNRHTVLMEWVDAPVLRSVKEVGHGVKDVSLLYAELMDLIVRLAANGLVHGDFNEFNLLVKEEQEETSLGNTAEETDTEIAQEKIRLIPVLIDFPQMISVDHPNAEMQFDRDVQCIKTFFSRRFRFESESPGPFLKDATENLSRSGVKRLDVEAEASGFSRKMAKELEKYMKEVGVCRDDDEVQSEREDLDDPEGTEETNEKEEEEHGEADAQVSNLVVV